MFSLFRYFRKRAALRQYALRLGPALRRTCGRRRHYSTKQVRQCAAAHGLDLAFICFAYSMYCSREEFERHHTESGQSCDYDAMRSEANVFFQSPADDSWTNADHTADHSPNHEHAGHNFHGTDHGDGPGIGGVE